MSSEFCIEKYQSGRRRSSKKVTVEVVEIALAQAGVAIVDAVRVNNCATSLYLEGGGIYCLYDKGTIVLQGKPSAKESRTFESLVQPGKPPRAVQKHELEVWEEWFQANHAGGQI